MIGQCYLPVGGGQSSELCGLDMQSGWNLSDKNLAKEGGCLPAFLLGTREVAFSHTI